MAHARRAPPGYLEAFEANVVVDGGAWIVVPRKRPLRAEDVAAIERRYDVWFANLR